MLHITAAVRTSNRAWRSEGIFAGGSFLSAGECGGTGFEESYFIVHETAP